MSFEVFTRLSRRLVLARRMGASASFEAVEKAEQIFYIEYCQPGMVVFDVGANVGEWSLLFSRFVGDAGSVHAFEASSETFERLRQIIALSRRPNIVLTRAAIADRPGLAQLHVYDSDHAGFASLAKRPLRDYGVKVEREALEEVPATTLDRYCAEHGIARINLLKLDVEGAEYQAMLGASGLLAEKRVDCIVFEFGQTTFDMGNRPREIHEYLKTHGYVVRNLVETDPIFPGGTDVSTARFSMHVAEPRR